MKFSKEAIVFILGLCLLGVGESAIMSGQERSEKLEATRALLESSVQPTDERLLAQAPSPFEKDLGITQNTKVIATSRSDLTEEELLEVLASKINPTGIFVFGGEFILIFNEKKIKSGSEIGVTYQGKEYNVIIADVTRNAYVVEFGDSQLQQKLQ